MRYFYLDPSRQLNGPFTPEELLHCYADGRIQFDTEVRQENTMDWLPFHQVYSHWQSLAEVDGSINSEEAPPPFPSDENPGGGAPNQLKRHILVPWEEIRNLRWLDNQRLLAVAAIGLFPLLIIGLLSETGNLRGAFWATGFYFSALWAFFFFYVFPAPGVTVRNSLICFFGTGIFSISILQIIYWLLSSYTPLLDWTQIPFDAPLRFTLTRWAAFVVGVGLPEEFSKALVLFFLWRNNRSLAPQTMLFYGLIAGLGFGIYEGIWYQERLNFFLSGVAQKPAADAVANYYLLNMVRLTALPFIHAIWTGIAGYFIGFACQYPERKAGLLVIALGLPAFLHGTYNATGSTLASLGVALISVLALNLYLAKSRDFENVLTPRS